MKHSQGRWKVAGLTLSFVLALVAVTLTQGSKPSGRPSMTTDEDYHRAMKELSNWGRWGKDDGLGAANLVTPAKRKQAAALIKEGVTISLAHDVLQETGADSPVKVERTPTTVNPNGGS